MEPTAPPPARRRSAWRFGVPVVCLLAGMLLAATHGVSGGDEIRRSDAPGSSTWSGKPSSRWTGSAPNATPWGRPSTPITAAARPPTRP